MDDASPATRGLPQPLGIDLLHVFVLASFAFAQPVYDLLGRHTTYFVARGSQPVDVVALVLVLSLALPAILAGGLLLARALGAKLYVAACALLQLVLVATIALPVTRTWPGPGLAILVPVGLGLLFALAYLKLRAVRLFLTLASPAVLVFPIVFLFATPVSKVVFAQPPPSPADALAPPPESHVIVVVFDMLPVTALMDEHQDLDAGRYPGFARLGARSVWFRQARTVSKDTTRAVSALLTGLYPRKGALALLEDYPRNLFTLFGAAGDIHAFEPVTRLCPETLCGKARSRPLRRRLRSLFRDTTIVTLHLLLPQGLTGRLPPIDIQWGSFGATAVAKSRKPTEPESEEARRVRLKKELFRHAMRFTNQDRLGDFETFLEGLGSPASRNLSFLHLDVPHGPFRYLASGKTYIPPGPKDRRLRLLATLGLGPARPGRNTWGPDRYLVDLAYQRLTHQILVADQLVSRLLERLEELGVLERSLLVVTADHGQGFEPGESRRSMVDADTVHVPLFIKLPGQTPGVVDNRAVEIVDVLPTIVDALGLEGGWKLDGFSLHPDSSDEAAIRNRKPRRLQRNLAVCLRRKLDLVAAGSPEIPAVGPHRQLVGRRIAEVMNTARTGYELTRLDQVSLDQADCLAEVDLTSDFVPAYLTGSVESQDEPWPLDLAIAVNGVIRATLTAHRSRDGATRFAALVAESSFVAGANTWAIYRLRDHRAAAK